MRSIFLLMSLSVLGACGDNADNSVAAVSQISAATPKPTKCTITSNSIGDIALGNTIAQVRLGHPQAVLTPLKDNEDVAFTSIKITPEIEIFAYTENTNTANANNSETNPITYLSTASRVCKTADGVHPDMLLADAEQVYGAVQQIIMSEADAAQTAEFDEQPPELSFQIDDSGAFDLTDKSLPKITTDYQDGAKIKSIAVVNLPAEDVASTAQ